MFLLNCISAFTGIILIYFCIAVGQLFSKHRILMALLILLGLTALVSVIVLLTSVLSGTLPNTIGFGSETTRFFTESYSQTEYFAFYYEELSHTRHCASSDCLCDHALYFVEEDQFKLDFEKIFEQQKRCPSVQIEWLPQFVSLRASFSIPISVFSLLITALLPCQSALQCFFVSARICILIFHLTEKFSDCSFFG